MKEMMRRILHGIIVVKDNNVLHLCKKSNLKADLCQYFDV